MVLERYAEASRRANVSCHPDEERISAPQRAVPDDQRQSSIRTSLQAALARRRVLVMQAVREFDVPEIARRFSGPKPPHLVEQPIEDGQVIARRKAENFLEAVRLGAVHR